MSRKIIIFLGSLLLSWVGIADEVVLRADHPHAYTVQKGDTLWDISGRFLQRPWQWPDIWHANPQIENPHLIYPGDVIALSYADGRPILGIAARDRNVRLTPGVRVIAHEEAIKPIPLDAIQPFLSRPRVVADGEMDNAPYVVGNQDNHLAAGSGFRIYVRGLGETAADKFSVYRPGPVYRDPDTQEILGREALHIADARVEKYGDPATFVITNSYREVKKGDRLAPQEGLELPQFVPHAPAGAVDGRIISVIDGVSQISQHQVVVLNRGAADGLEPGHVLAVYQQGEVIKDTIASDIDNRDRRAEQDRVAREDPNPMVRMLQTAINDVQAADRVLRDFVGTPVEGSSAIKVQLPDERAGELMIFRAFDRVSYGLMMNLQRPAHINDLVRNP